MTELSLAEQHANLRAAYEAVVKVDHDMAEKLNDADRQLWPMLKDERLPLDARMVLEQLSEDIGIVSYVLVSAPAVDEACERRSREAAADSGRSSGAYPWTEMEADKDHPAWPRLIADFKAFQAAEREHGEGP
jgi:Trm5-related predicted tRNA methylase